MVESDLEGPWVKADHAFVAVAKGVPNGEQVFRVLSSYDDIRFFTEKVPGYEPGDTLMLIAPLLMAHGIDDKFLREIAGSPENTRMIPGAKEVIQYIKGFDNFYLISTSYEQYVERAASILGVPNADAFCTNFPIDDLSSRVEEKDKEMVREWAQRIAAMPVIGVNESGIISSNCLEAKEALDEFFWEILPDTSFSEVMEEVKPVGGRRKYRALTEALSKQGKSLDEAAVVGDSITDSVMLAKAREAGALALSFNGNRYSIQSSNIAVISGNCWVTAVIAEVYRNGGLDGVKGAVENWGTFMLGRLRSGGLLSGYLAKKILETSKESFPRVFWLESSNMEEVIRESEAFRKKVRGTSIGELG